MLERENGYNKRNILISISKKNFIRPGLSVAVAPALFVRKLSRWLRFCINYWILNAIIIKNQYSILLINETFAKFFNIAKFTKININLVFNKTCIKKRQKWLITFNTKYSQSKYLIILLKLCNTSKNFFKAI